MTDARADHGVAPNPARTPEEEAELELGMISTNLERKRRQLAKAQQRVTDVQNRVTTLRDDIEALENRLANVRATVRGIGEGGAP